MLGVFRVSIGVISGLFWFMFFFFKQKTAYEMRMSDWSSDVCSSDLDAVVAPVGGKLGAPAVEDAAAARRQQPHADAVLVGQQGVFVGFDHLQVIQPAGQQTEQRDLRGAQQQDRKSVV